MNKHVQLRIHRNDVMSYCAPGDPDVIVELQSSNLLYYKISLPLTDNKEFSYVKL